MRGKCDHGGNRKPRRIPLFLKKGAQSRNLRRQQQKTSEKPLAKLEGSDFNQLKIIGEDGGGIKRGDRETGVKGN